MTDETIKNVTDEMLDEDVIKVVPVEPNGVGSGKAAAIVCMAIGLAVGGIGGMLYVRKKKRDKDLKEAAEALNEDVEAKFEDTEK